MTVAYGLVFLPLRPILLAMSPEALAAITGSRVALVAVGVLTRTGEATLWWSLPLAVLSIMKFHWVYWWAGRLWGDRVLTRLSGSTPRALRRIARAERLVHRYQVLAIAVTYIPLPVAREVLLATLGASGTKLRTFLLVDLGVAVVTQTLCVALGYAVGERGLPLLAEYAKWAGVVSIGVIVAMVLTWWRRRRADCADERADLDAEADAADEVSRRPTP
ncbi:MAG: hypothetical protein Q4P32_10925 [Micrococcales bacterium]|nr:hypothetical protein [Micrococcales bacterium]